jgi:hypothetical protein
MQTIPRGVGIHIHTGRNVGVRASDGGVLQLWPHPPNLTLSCIYNDNSVDGDQYLGFRAGNTSYQTISKQQFIPL